ncbi:MAG: DUF4276 family protein [Dehalococcoidales bacterium]|nr:DUF4276 family protein [Dehalococcoidales bacterium]
MVKEIRIYIEGGGDERETKATFRMGYSKFFRQIVEIVRDKGIRWNIIASGSRQNCFDDFKNAIQSHPQAFNIMLVDAEREVTKNVKQHLKDSDNWELVCTEDHYQLIAQTMEAWLIADKAALAKYYGQGFNAGAIPNTIDVELIEKARLYISLQSASKNTQKGEYAKIKHGADLLALVDPQEIRKKAGYCDRLFRLLESLTA